MHQVKEGLKKELGLTDGSFHPSADHGDILFSVPTRASRKIISDDDTVVDLCPTIDDYMIAVVPSAPQEGGSTNITPGLSTLFTFKPHPAPLPLAPEANTIDSVLTLLRSLELDLGKAEAQRKEDLEATEAQRKEDLGATEAQRKEDAEKAKAQRKKDAEKAEVQRKKDVAKVEELNRKLQMNIKSLKDTHKADTQRLEQRASERELEWTRSAAATQLYIETLASDVEATTDFLTIGDESGLDRIKRRNLSDRAQAELALTLQLSSNKHTASIDFRTALGQSDSLEVRQQRLLELLKEDTDFMSSPAARLITQPEALNLLSDRFPQVRLAGDQVAHAYRERAWYEGSVLRSVQKDRIALSSLLDFILPKQ